MAPPGGGEDEGGREALQKQLREPGDVITFYERSTVARRKKTVGVGCWLWPVITEISEESQINLFNTFILVFAKQSDNQHNKYKKI